MGKKYNPNQSAELERVRQKLDAEGIKNFRQLNNLSAETWAKLDLGVETIALFKAHLEELPIGLWIEDLQKHNSDKSNKLKEVRECLESQDIKTLGQLKRSSAVTSAKLNFDTETDALVFGRPPSTIKK